MRYTLSGQIQTCYSHDSSKTRSFEEYFDADDNLIAATIARAMLQSRKIKSESGGNAVEHLTANLRTESGINIWTSSLIHEKTRTTTEIVTPEHFKEQFITP